MRALIFTAFVLGLLPRSFGRPYFADLIYFWFSLMNPHRLMYANHLPYAAIIAVTSLLAWVLSREPKRLPLDRVTILLIAWLCWTCVTTAFALNPDGVLGADEKLIYFTKVVGFSLLAFGMISSRKRVDALICVLVLSIGFYGLKGGLWAILTGGHQRVFGPEGSMIGDNNDLGCALLMTLPLMVYLRSVYVHTYTRFGLLLMIVTTATAILFTYSRAAFVAMLGMCLVAGWKSRHRLKFLFGAAVAAALFVHFAPPAWFARMDTIETYQKDASAEDRLHMWQVALAVVKARPILGGGFNDGFDPAAVNPYAAADGISGISPSSRVRAPHSIYFEALGEQGIPGFIIFLSLLSCVWFNGRYLIRRARNDPRLKWAGELGRALQFSLAGFCIAGAFATLATYDGLYVLIIVSASARRMVMRTSEQQLAVSELGAYEPKNKSHAPSDVTL